MPFRYSERFFYFLILYIDKYGNNNKYYGSIGKDIPMLCIIVK